jgi:hypothetical protein
MKRFFVLALSALFLALGWGVALAQVEPCDSQVDPCYGTDWDKGVKTEMYTPTCEATIVYYYRKCGIPPNEIYEFQIVGIRLIGDCPNWVSISLLNWATQQVVNDLKIYPPYVSPQCSDYWRSAIASCWSSIYYGDAASVTDPNWPMFPEIPPGYILPAPNSLLHILAPCHGGECCSQRLRICIIDELGGRSITTLEFVSTAGNCENATIYEEFAEKAISYTPCTPICDELVFERRSDLNINNPSNMLIEHNINSKTGNLDYSITSSDACTITYKIYDLIGNTLSSKDISISSGTNSFEIDLSQLKSGVYIISFSSDGDTIHTNKVMITE